MHSATSLSARTAAGYAAAVTQLPVLRAPLLSKYLLNLSAYLNYVCPENWL